MHIPTLPRALVARNMNINAFFSVTFGTLWLVNGVNALRPMMLTAPLFTALAALSIALYAVGVRFWQTIRPSPARPAPAITTQATRYINRATALQIAVSIGGPVALAFTGHNALGLPLIVLSVGLYLLALAPVLGVSHYYASGTLLSLIPVVALLIAPPERWVAIIGLAGGSVQIVTAVISYGRIPQLRRTARMEEMA